MYVILAKNAANKAKTSRTKIQKFFLLYKTINFSIIETPGMHNVQKAYKLL